MLSEILTRVLRTKSDVAITYQLMREGRFIKQKYFKTQIDIDSYFFLNFNACVNGGIETTN